MHEQARQFTLYVKSILPNFFNSKKVLDVGSGDINGNNRFLFDNCDYQGNDVIQAPNVTIVSKTADLPFEDNIFDTVVSTECFEHDPQYSDSFKKIVKMLKPGGLFFFTCASTGRAEHGTLRTSSRDSYGTIGMLDDMVNYYKNLTEKDLDDSINIKENFSHFASYYNSQSKDLYFWGVKKSGNNIDLKVPEYSTYGIVNTTTNIL